MSVCVLVTRVNSAKTAESTEMPLGGGQTGVSACMRGPGESCIRWSSCGRHMANTIDRFVLGGDADYRYRCYSNLLLFSAAEFLARHVTRMMSVRPFVCSPSVCRVGGLLDCDHKLQQKLRKTSIWYVWSFALRRPYNLCVERTARMSRNLSICEAS